MTTPLASRDDVGLRPPNGRVRFTAQHITLHYGGDSPWRDADQSSATAFRDSTDHNRCASVLRAWQDYHMDTHGWLDIAYNSAVCPHGVRFDLRGPGIKSGAQGTVTGNATSAAVVYIAGVADPLTDEAKAAYLDEQDRFEVPLRFPHHFWHATGCPGEVDWWIDEGFPAPGAIVVPEPPPIVLPPAIHDLPWWWRGRNLRLLKPMMRGTDVGWAQNWLWLAGAGGREHGDEIFGSRTRQFVINFQSDDNGFGLTADGIIGPNTARALAVATGN